MTQDFLTNIYRMKQLGFNAVRLPYRQTDFNEPWNPRIIEHECQVAPAVSLFLHIWAWIGCINAGSPCGASRMI